MFSKFSSEMAKHGRFHVSETLIESSSAKYYNHSKLYSYKPLGYYCYLSDLL